MVDKAFWEAIEEKANIILKARKEFWGKLYCCRFRAELRLIADSNPLPWLDTESTSFQFLIPLLVQKFIFHTSTEKIPVLLMTQVKMKQ